jgi:3-dehydroquinate dehydratase I
MMPNETTAKTFDFLPPRAVVASISSLDALQAFDPTHLSSQCDIVEFRLDGYHQHHEIAAGAMEKCPLPCLLTVRDPAEGALNSLGLIPRLALYRALTEKARLVDIEIRNLSVFAEIIEQAHDQQALVVASYHDFQHLPTEATMRELAEEARTHGADIVKFAVTPQSAHDVYTLARLFEEPLPLPTSAMGMGPFGKISRLWLGQLGSVLNYGYIDTATVTGQWPAAELRRLLQALA